MDAETARNSFPGRSLFFLIVGKTRADHKLTLAMRIPVTTPHMLGKLVPDATILVSLQVKTPINKVLSISLFHKTRPVRWLPLEGEGRYVQHTTLTLVVLQSKIDLYLPF